MESGAVLSGIISRDNIEKLVSQRYLLSAVVAGGWRTGTPPRDPSRLLLTETAVRYPLTDKYDAQRP